MSRTSAHGIDSFTEHCKACDRDTPHRVRIDIRTESRKPTNAEFSREPYRVATCSYCGRTTEQRMNNA